MSYATQDDSPLTEKGLSFMTTDDCNLNKELSGDLNSNSDTTAETVRAWGAWSGTVSRRKHTPS
eukprot:980044-Pleurochrysis_carterae.AAC.4